MTTTPERTTGWHVNELEGSVSNPMFVEYNIETKRDEGLEETRRSSTENKPRREILLDRIDESCRKKRERSVEMDESIAHDILFRVCEAVSPLCPEAASMRSHPSVGQTLSRRKGENV